MLEVSLESYQNTYFGQTMPVSWSTKAFIAIFVAFAKMTEFRWNFKLERLI